MLEGIVGERAIVQRPVKLHRRATPDVLQLLVMTGEHDRSALVLAQLQHRGEARREECIARAAQLPIADENVQVLELSQREVAVHERRERGTLERNGADAGVHERAVHCDEIPSEPQAAHCPLLRRGPKPRCGFRGDEIGGIAPNLVVHQGNHRVLSGPLEKQWPVGHRLHQLPRPVSRRERSVIRSGVQQQRELG